MSTKSTLALSVIAAAALALVVGPVLIQSASAIPADKQVNESHCNDPDHPQFADRESCPGESENSAGVAGDERQDENVCTARNNGQAKDCPPDSTIIIVNGNPQ
jgi:hypothetical protein